MTNRICKCESCSAKTIPRKILSKANTVWIQSGRGEESNKEMKNVMSEAQCRLRCCGISWNRLTCACCKQDVKLNKLNSQLQLSHWSVIRHWQNHATIVKQKQNNSCVGMMSFEFFKFEITNETAAAADKTSCSCELLQNLCLSQRTLHRLVKTSGMPLSPGAKSWAQILCFWGEMVRTNAQKALFCCRKQLSRGCCRDCTAHTCVFPVQCCLSQSQGWKPAGQLQICAGQLQKHVELCAKVQRSSCIVETHVRLQQLGFVQSTCNWLRICVIHVNWCLFAALDCWFCFFHVPNNVKCNTQNATSNSCHSRCQNRRLLPPTPPSQASVTIPAVVASRV